jgi:hypothetical protein
LCAAIRPIPTRVDSGAVPGLGRMLQDKDAERSQKVMQAMLQMKKLDIAGLEAAHRQR